MRSVRRQADRLAIDYGHFTGQRRWTDESLAAAIDASSTWADVVARLGLADPSSQTALKGHAVRLGIEIDHLRTGTARRSQAQPMNPQTAYLSRAGSLLAASWFTLCGHEVSWPLEPCRYDLLVQMNNGIRRIQVKTTTVRQRDSWTVWLSSTRSGTRLTYDLDDIDDFFVIDGDFSYYLIPVHRVGGLHAIALAAYADCRVGTAYV
jgi:PD-(D/E)XK endonuclease